MTDAERIAQLEAENLKMREVLKRAQFGFQNMIELRILLNENYEKACRVEVEKLREALKETPHTAHAAKVREAELAVIEAAKQIHLEYAGDCESEWVGVLDTKVALAHLEQVREERHAD